MTERALRLAWPALLGAAVLLLPFLGKAFTIDDPLFLFQARQLLVDPLHPTACDVVWTEVPQRLSAIMPSGPVMAYLLFPILALGGAEASVHLLQLAIFAGGVWATVALALRLGLCPAAARLAGLLLCASPAVLAMAGTAMPDVAAMSLGVLGLERALAHRQRPRIGTWLAAVVALALAGLSRSHLFALVPLAVLALGAPADWLGGAPAPQRGAAWLRRWGAGALPHLAVGAAVALICAVLIRVTADPRPGRAGVAAAAQGLLTWRSLHNNLVAFFLHFALCLPLCLPWAVLRAPELHRRRARVLLGLGTAVAALIIALGDHRRLLWIAPAAGLGLWALVDVLADAWQRRDGRQLWLGLWLLVPLPLLFYIHMPAKYHVAVAPAVALLCGERLAAAADRLRHRLLAGVLVAGAVLGVLILQADARFAGLGREAVQRHIQGRVARGEQVWFAGHWGFQWYAEQAGARPLTFTLPHPRPGDIVVASRRADEKVLAAFPHRHRRDALSDTTPGGRIMSLEDGAGFYSNGIGFLPWTWGSGEIDRYDVWQISDDRGPPTALRGP